MSVEAYREAMRLLASDAAAELNVFKLEGASPAQVKELEDLLKLEMPASYKAMLLDCGILMFGGHSLSGIGRNGVKGSNSGSVHWRTMRGREDGSLSKTMIYVMPAGYGPDFVMDWSKLGSGGEPAVYEISPGGFKHGSDKLAESFGDFLLAEVRSSIEGSTEFKFDD